MFTGCCLCRRAPRLDDSMLGGLQACILEAWRPAAWRKLGSLWRPVAPCGTLWHGSRAPIERIDLGGLQPGGLENSMIRCIEPGGLGVSASMHRAWRSGVSMLVDDGKDEG